MIIVYVIIGLIWSYGMFELGYDIGRNKAIDEMNPNSKHKEKVN